jgi:hypothetical protein
MFDGPNMVAQLICLPVQPTCLWLSTFLSGHPQLDDLPDSTGTPIMLINNHPHPITY